MRVEDLSFSDPQKNLDRDDELLALAPAEGEVLRFWESPTVFVVLGRACREDAEVDGVACRRDGVPVLRRSSGGGTVLQGPGCLNFSLVLSKTRHPDMFLIGRSYHYILGKIIEALAGCGVAAQFRPVCDIVLASDEKKISGNAQRRGRGHVLHHGTILHGFDLDLIARYLNMPPRMPEYRRERSHAEFVKNVDIDVVRFKTALADIWRVC